MNIRVPIGRLTVAVLLALPTNAQTQALSDHLDRTTAQDLATLVESAFEAEVTATIQRGEARVVDPGGKVLWHLHITRDQKGLPQRLEAEGSEPLVLRTDWQELDCVIDAKREAYRNLTPAPFDQAAFDQWLSHEQDVVKMLAPIQGRMAGYFAKTLMQARREEVRRVSVPVQAAGLRRRPKWTEPVEFLVLAASISLASWGTYDVLHAQAPRGLNEITLGAAGGAVFFLNYIPFFLTGVHESLLDKLVLKMRERRANANRLPAAAARLEARAQRRRVNEERAKRVYDIGGVKVRLAIGGLTDVAAEAWIVPEPPTRALRDGLGRTLTEAGAGPGLAAYEGAIKQSGAREYGQVVVTEAGPEAHPDHLVHVVTVAPPAGPLTRDNAALRTRRQYAIVREALLAALTEARARRFGTLATPLVGTGRSGRLTPKASVLALLEAIASSGEAKRDGPPLRLTIASYDAYQDFEEVAAVLEAAERDGIQTSRTLPPNEIDQHLWSCEAELAGDH